MRHNQNRRSRGRNNRKGPNPLTRSFESNGPDVKVRGTAAHIAEKYTSLARDAHSAGDIVAVESYLQHAEHYNRIVMAAQAQFQQSQPQFRDGPDEAPDDDRQMNGRSRFEYNGESRTGDDEGDERIEAGEEEGDDRGYQPRQQAPRQDGYQRQQGPRQERYQYRDRQDRDNRDDRNDRGDQRADRPEQSERGERPERMQRPENTERPERQETYNDREPRGEVVEAQPTEQESGGPSPRRRRGRPRNENGGESEGRNPDATPDGAAALAAFKSDS